jgi:hypothetical protein
MRIFQKERITETVEKLVNLLDKILFLLCLIFFTLNFWRAVSKIYFSLKVKHMYVQIFVIMSTNVPSKTYINFYFHIILSIDLNLSEPCLNRWLTGIIGVHLSVFKFICRWNNRRVLDVPLYHPKTLKWTLRYVVNSFSQQKASANEMSLVIIWIQIDQLIDKSQFQFSIFSFCKVQRIRSTTWNENFIVHFNFISRHSFISILTQWQKCCLLLEIVFLQIKNSSRYTPTAFSHKFLNQFLTSDFRTTGCYSFVT